MGQLGTYFGHRVRALRTERGWSQAKLAEAIGTSEEWVRRIERGAKSPSFDTIEALSTAFGVSVSTLFAGHGGDEARFEKLLSEIQDLSAAEIGWLEDAARLLRRKPR